MISMLATFRRWIRRWIPIWQPWSGRVKILSSWVNTHKRVHHWICCRCPHNLVRGWKRTSQRLIRLSQVFVRCNSRIWITYSNIFAFQFICSHQENICPKCRKCSQTGGGFIHFQSNDCSPRLGCSCDRCSCSQTQGLPIWFVRLWGSTWQRHYQHIFRLW